MKHTGSCHCGAVRFEVELDPAKPAGKCNCSICTKVSQWGAIVKPESFRLLEGVDQVTAYEWGAKISRRFFCKRCGVHCYAQGHLKEVGGDYVSVNLNCIDDLELTEMPTVYWDGRHDNWQAGPRSTPWPILRTSA